MSFFIRTGNSIHRNEGILKKKVNKKRGRDAAKDKVRTKKKHNDDEIESEDDEDYPHRGQNGEQHEESDDGGETIQEKRLRLAKIYLEEIQRKEQAQLDDGVSNLDAVTSHLKDELLEKSNKLRKCVADQYTGFDEHVNILKCKDHHLSLTCLVISPDNKFIYSGSKDSTIVKWSVNEGSKIKSIRRIKGTDSLGTIFCLAISSDNKFLASGGTKNVIDIWNPESLDHVHTFKGHKKAVTGLAFRRNASTLFSVSQDRTVKLWNLLEMSYVETLFGHQSEITAVDALNAERAVTSGGRDNTIRLWKVIEESQLIFNGHTGSIDCVKLINEDHFVSSGDDGCLCLWGCMKKKPLCSVATAHGVDSISQEPNWISSVAALLNTDLIASGSNDGYVKLWKCGKGFRTITHLFSIPVTGFINAMSFTSDGNFLFVAAGKEHRLGRWSKINGAINCIVKIPLLKSSESV